MTSTRIILAAPRRAFTLAELLIVIALLAILTALVIGASITLSERSERQSTENTLRLLDLALVEWETLSDRKLSWGQESQPYIGSEYDVISDVPHVFSVTQILRRIRRQDAVRELIAQIPPEQLYRFDTSEDPPVWILAPSPNDPDIVNASEFLDDPATLYTDNSLGLTQRERALDGELAVLDAWGTPIRAVHPGRVASEGVFDDFNEGPVDDDGTVWVSLDRAKFGGAEEVYGTVIGRRVLFVSAGPDKEFGTVDPSLPADDEQRERAEDNVYSYAPGDPP